jgi:putative nucleotidyltransferase with HDIG domain
MNNTERRDLHRRIKNISSLPTIPSVLRRISEIIEKPNVSLTEISNFISNDPALTTKILKMINSAVYGFPGRISLVSHATVLLGLNVIKGLLIGVSVFEIMQKAMVGLWEHSLGCAVTAKLIAQRKRLNEPEEVYAAGLLHDIGKVILILEYPEEYEKASNEAEAKCVTIYELETNHFIENHATVGAWMSEKWHFPNNLTEVIKYHHNPLRSKYAPMETAIVHLSDILVRARGIGFAGDRFVPAVNPTAFELLEMNEQDIKEILAEMDCLPGITEDFSLS